MYNIYTEVIYECTGDKKKCDLCLARWPLAVLSASTAAAAAVLSAVASLASPVPQSAAPRSSAVQCWPGSRPLRPAGSSLYRSAGCSRHTCSASVSMRLTHPSGRSRSARSLYRCTPFPV